MSSTLSRVCAALAAALAPMLAQAQAGGILAAKIEPARVIEANPLALTIIGSGTGRATCGLRIDFGDGRTEDVKMDAERGPHFPYRVTHTYVRTGSYEITVRGVRVTTHLPCSGKAEARAEVIEASAAKPSSPVQLPAAQAPAEPVSDCPQGWKTLRRTKDGSFTCSLQVRCASQFQCPQGLEYWEKGLRAGCRKPPAPAKPGVKAPAPK